MSNGGSSRAIIAIAVAVAIALLAIVAPRFIFEGMTARIVTTQSLELLLSLLAIALLGKCRFADHGFRMPAENQKPPAERTHWVRIIAFAPLLGMLATILMLAIGGGGIPFARKLSIPQMILFVWVFSSIIEEIFTRGFLQGQLSSLSGKYIGTGSIRVELPVLISAFFFGCMHFVLLFSGVDARTMIVTFCFTFSLGLMAGYVRQKTGSLLPAISAHFLANVGGMIGGIIYTIINFMITGQLPSM